MALRHPMRVNSDETGIYVGKTNLDAPMIFAGRSSRKTLEGEASPYRAFPSVKNTPARLTNSVINRLALQPKARPMCSMTLEQRLHEILQRAPLRMETLEIVRSLHLPDWAVGAGFIRAAVWDELSGKPVMSPVDDIDVLYFDATNCAATDDVAIEDRLRTIRPDLPWSVRNQARMHIRNGDQPYNSTADALRFWLETPTCVAAYLDEEGCMQIVAPHGLEDLFSMRIHPTPRGRERAMEYNSRSEAKRWHEKWPNVTVEIP